MSLLPFLDIGMKLIDKLVPDPQAKAAAQLELAKMQQTGELAQLAADTDLAKGQLAINQVEAASSSLFVSGWRPFIGWVCGSAFAYSYVVQPFMAFILAANGIVFPLPAFDMNTLSTVLFGILGLSIMRSTEKVVGVKKGG